MAPLQSCRTTVIYKDRNTYFNRHYIFITFTLGGKPLSSEPLSKSYPHLHLFPCHLSPASPSTPGSQGPSVLSPQKAKQARCWTGYPERSARLSSLEPSQTWGFLQQTPILRWFINRLHFSWLHAVKIKVPRVSVSRRPVGDDIWLAGPSSTCSLMAER